MSDKRVPVRGFLATLDRRWPSVTFVIVTASVGGGSSLWSALTEPDPLIARLEAQVRRDVYGSLAGSSGALLGFSIASLAVLLALDQDRPAVARMRALPAWSLLNRTLLVAGGLLGLTLVLSTVGIAYDGGATPHVAFEIITVTAASTAFAELAVGGAALALVISNAVRDPGDGDSANRD